MAAALCVVCLLGAARDRQLAAEDGGYTHAYVLFGNGANVLEEVKNFTAVLP